MRFLKFFFALVLTLGLIYFLNFPQNLSVSPIEIPALGKLMNPFTGFWKNADEVANFQNQSFNFPELSDKVSVVYDERMVPHIFAQNEYDLAYVQGYVTAQHRLFQMDFITRYAGGRLAEVIGESILNTDKLQRRKGMLWAAKKTEKAWQKNSKEFEIIEAYAKGVNAYTNSLKPADYPIEFKILGYQPEEWNPLKSALLIKYMAQNLCARENDLEATNALALFGQETFNFLYPEWNPKQEPIIPKGTKYEWADTLKADNQKVAPLEMIGMLKHQPLEKPDEFLGSNNWAVAGKKTQSGNPILASDPHLRLTLPSIWYETQLQTPELNTYGVCLPGAPGVVIGFNENIAWGQTNVGHDVLDWYKIKWTDDSKQTYWLDGSAKEIDYVYEGYKIKGQEEILWDTVKYTYWGPIVYENDTLPKQDLAMRWIAHDAGTGNELKVFTQMNRAKNYEDYSKALVDYESPAQNYVFAAKDGDIAIKVNGKFPIKENQQGRFVQQGDKTANAWKGWIPKSQVPQIKNPARGYVSSANQHSTDPSYPYYYNAGFGDYRGRTVNRFLDSLNNVTIEDMMAMQNNNFSILAEEFTPLLLQNLDTTNLNSIQKRMVKTLQDWDYKFESGSTAAVIFQVWANEFYDMTWDEVLSVKDSMPILMPETWRTIALLENWPESPFFDDKSTLEKETSKEIATRSFAKMFDELGTKIIDPNFNWANHRGTVIKHLGQIPAFSREVSNGGYRFALNAISKFAGPSWRMVVELGDEVKAFGVYPGGQSGNPGSKFYDDSLDEWEAGKYHELFFMKDENDDRQAVLFKQEFIN